MTDKERKWSSPDAHLSFDDLLVRYMLRNNWSTDDLGLEASMHILSGKNWITQDTISFYVEGLMTPGPGRQVALAKALGCEVATIKRSIKLMEARRRAVGYKRSLQ